MVETLTLEIPDAIYRRLLDTASATNRPLEEIVLRVFEVGSPPSWADAPEPFQADLAALDRLDNESLWAIAHGQLSDPNPEQLEILVESPTDSVDSENQEQLDALQMESDRFMLRKAQAAVILRWRGCHVPLP